MLSWEPLRSDRPSILRGHVGLHIARWHLRLHGCPVFHNTTSGDIWVLPPSKPVIDRDGQGRKDATGKTIFVAVVEFDDRASHAAFSRAAIRALDRYSPTWREGGR